MKRQVTPGRTSHDSVSRIVLTGSPSSEALADIRRAGARAAATGQKTLEIDLDELTVLDHAVIATLILMLRDARERAVGLTLRAENERILATLRATGLDKIFSIGNARGALA